MNETQHGTRPQPLRWRSCRKLAGRVCNLLQFVPLGGPLPGKRCNHARQARNALFLCKVCIQMNKLQRYLVPLSPRSFSWNLVQMRCGAGASCRASLPRHEKPVQKYAHDQRIWTGVAWWREAPETRVRQAEQSKSELGFLATVVILNLV